VNRHEALQFINSKASEAKALASKVIHDRRVRIGGVGLTVLVLAGAGVYEYITHEAKPMATLPQPALLPSPFPTPEPSPTATPSNEPTLIPGAGFIVEWNGIWQCDYMNNPAYPDTFKLDEPTVVVPLDAMRRMGDTTPPFLIIRGSDGPIKVEQTFSWQFRRMANGSDVCVDGK